MDEIDRSHQVSLADVPSDIIRAIIPMTGEPYLMRAISPHWNAIALEYTRAKPHLIIDKLQLVVSHGGRMKIKVRAPRPFLGYFCLDKWTRSVDETDSNLINAKYKTQLILGDPEVLIHKYSTLALMALSYYFLSPRKSAFMKFAGCRYVHRVMLRELEMARAKMDTLWIENVDRDAFDRLRAHFEATRFRRVVVCTTYLADEDYNYIAGETRKINASHHVVTELLANQT